MPGGDESESAVTVAFHSSDAQPQRPPTPAHFTDVKFADPPHRCAGGGKTTDSEGAGDAQPDWLIGS